MEYWDYVFGTVAAVSLGGALVLFGVVVGGLFVLRTKRDGYEPLLPPLMGQKEEMTSYNLDEFDDGTSTIEKILSERAEEDPIMKVNSRFKEQMNG